MTHELKIQKQWADAKLAGEKPFEIRRNDRGFQKGDTVRYSVVDPKTSLEWRDENDNPHPLELCDFLITYVIEGKDGLEKGYCVYADCPVPKKAPEGPEGTERAHGEAYSEGFMHITKGGLGATEKAPEERGRTTFALPAVPDKCDSYEPDGSFLIVGAKPCKHYDPVAHHDEAGIGTCKCTGCIHCGHECPTGGWPYVTVRTSSPVSADLGSGATPSNGTAEPLAPPSPLAETSDGEVHTDVKSVPKSSEECKDFVGRFDGICRFAYATTPSEALPWPSGAFSCGCKTSANYGKRCPIERSI